MILNVFMWFATTVGIAVIGYFALSFAADFLRCAYWAVWTTIPVARNYDGKVKVRMVLLSIWRGFVSEWTGSFAYDTIRCQHYSHGYWPWEPRAWYLIDKESDDETL